MLTETFNNSRVTYVIRYQIEEENNSVYLALDSLEYQCHTCHNEALVDLSLVPVHNISLLCSSCEQRLCNIQEDDFKRQLVPQK